MKLNFKSALLFLVFLLLVGIGFIVYQQRKILARQEYIHKRGSTVMPFDLNKTTHVFSQTKEGGIQKIQVKDPRDSEQIELIQTHLQKEASAFNQGNFSDPSSLHGEGMPGLEILSQSADKLHVEYADLPDGAQLTYITNDRQILDALHMWFMAQLQDHGMDAMEHN